MSKPYAIFGAGLSALAARRLAQAKGAEVVLFDERGKGDRASFESGDETEFACFVFSPGFASEHPWRILAESSGLPCLSEIAFAASHWKGRLIGITGTNGKSTLTALLDKALRHSGYTSMAAGNIGYPLSDAVLSGSNHAEAFAVVEISSFQAELAGGLELDALLWTNFAEDHLDRYASMERYFAAKASLFNCLKKDGICVVGPQVAHWMGSMRKQFDACTIAYEDLSLLSKLSPDSVFQRYPYSENFSLAAELWWLLDKQFAPLIEAANSFALAPHRLTVVAEFGGVRYWNDSKATNFHATLAALESVERPIIWIGGGRVKGGDVEAFAREVARRVDAAVLYGEVADRLAQAFDGSLHSVQMQPRFADAVHMAAELASSMAGANVLLSPGFSSFDQFASYDERGKSFTDTVLSLKKAGKTR
jgi:UDP-N-acetylmuramoylalanine--D-glutamate ligase